MPSEKNGTKTVPLGYFCYKWYPIFKGALFYETVPLGHWVPEIVLLRVPYYPSEEGYHFSTPRGTFCLNNHVYETVPRGQWGTKIVPLRGTILRTVI